MKDRQPTRPGRVRITPENGEAYYAVMEMADEPTEVGTPPIKANLLKDSTAALLGGGADMVPDEAFIALKNLIDNLSPESLGAAMVETGTYVGSDADTKTLNFGFSPKVVLIGGTTANRYLMPMVYGQAETLGFNSGFSGGTKITLTWNGATLTIGGSYAVNAYGTTYRYVAIT